LVEPAVSAESERDEGKKEKEAEPPAAVKDVKKAPSKKAPAKKRAR
jgi:hypothetical protein